MSENIVTTWFGDLVSHPQVIVEANTVQDIVDVMKNPGLSFAGLHPGLESFNAPAELLRAKLSSG